jgi:hypothetical protein
MLGKSVPACYRSVGLVTEDAGPQASKSTDPRQLPDIWKLARSSCSNSAALGLARLRPGRLPGDDEATTKQRRSDDAATTQQRRRDDAATTQRRRRDDAATTQQRPPQPQLVICATYATYVFIGLWSIWY